MITKLGFSKDLQKSFYITLILNVLSTFIFDAISLALQGATTAMNLGYTILSIAIIIIYCLRDTISEAFQTITYDIDMIFSEKLDNELTTKAANMLYYTMNKVPELKDSNTKKMSTSKILQTVNDFHAQKIHMIEFVITNGISLLTSIGMLYLSIKVATLQTSSPLTVIIFMSIFLIIYIVLMFIQTNRNKKEFEKKRNLHIASDEQKNDILNCESLSIEHMNFMIKRYLKSRIEIINISKSNNKKSFKEDFFINLIVAISSIFVIFMKITNIGFENFTTSTLLETVAFITMYTATIDKITRNIKRVFNLIEIKEQIKICQHDYNIINQVFEREYQKSKSTSTLDTIKLNKFKTYFVKDNGEENFSIETENDLNFNLGDIVFLTGKSGCGKSTFLNILACEIESEKEIVKVNNVPCIPKYLYHKTSSTLGINDLLSEITLDKKIDYVKLEEILKGVKIYEDLTFAYSTSDINIICENLSTTFAKNFSEGQRQRFILARFLYNLKDEESLILLDEPTLKLDGKTVDSVMEFMIEYLNRDRIIFISTHDVSSAKKYVTKTIEFSKGLNNNHFSKEV